MKDAFGNNLRLGDKVIYSTGGSPTAYVIGVVSELHPSKPKPNVQYYPPDRISINVKKTSKDMVFSKAPLLYASNVVLLKGDYLPVTVEHSKHPASEAINEKVKSRENHEDDPVPRPFTKSDRVPKSRTKQNATAPSGPKQKYKRKSP